VHVPPHVDLYPSASAPKVDEGFSPGVPNRCHLSGCQFKRKRGPGRGNTWLSAIVLSAPAPQAAACSSPPSPLKLAVTYRYRYLTLKVYINNPARPFSQAMCDNR